MKKILIIIFFIHILTLSSISAQLKDCSVYSKFKPKYLTCKAINFAEGTKNYQKKEWSKEKTKLDKLITKD